ncbi:hypothetical protein [Methanobacterium sp.]|uniref:hypothetical protein n=1 Tax=Methanobacterium sp. TaxID=2164 RepID=UPI003C723BDF
MKVLMAVLLVILMIGVTPAFATDSVAYKQNIAPTVVKEINGGIKCVSQVVAQPDNVINSVSNDASSGYIDGYDDDGNYIGNYAVVDSSDLIDTSDNPDGTDNYLVGSFNIPGEDVNYIDEPDNMVNSSSMDEFDDNLEALDTPDKDTDYISELDESSQPDENINELNTDDMDNEYDVITELDIEFEYNESSGVGELDESLDDDVGELDDGNYTVIDPSDVPSSETTSQIDTDVSTNCKPLIVTIVNGLCGVVQATLERLGNVWY